MHLRILNKIPPNGGENQLARVQKGIHQDVGGETTEASD